MAHTYITTHTEDGHSTFTKNTETDHEVKQTPFGSNFHVYTLNDPTPVDLSTEADIKAYQSVLANGLPKGTICPPNGTCVGIITVNGDQSSPVHRTTTLDIGYIIEGVVELHLEGGEMRVLKAGDTFVQRGTLHHWKNITPNSGVCKMFGVSYGAVSPIEVGGKKLETEFRV